MASEKPPPTHVLALINRAMTNIRRGKQTITPSPTIIPAASLMDRIKLRKKGA